MGQCELNMQGMSSKLENVVSELDGHTEHMGEYY